MQGKVGRRIRTNIAWAGVPRGTEGKVIGLDGSLLMVEWKLPGKLNGTLVKPLVDWFTQEEYEKYLEDV